jgi:uncharacterized protein (TIGR03067 family)
MRSIGIVVLGVACIVSSLYLSVGAAAQGDAKSSKKLDGKWFVVRQEERGHLVPAIVSKRLSMVIDGNKMEWYIGNPAPNFAATLTIDEEKKTIDAKITRSSFIGRTMLGIYKFENGALHMCWGEIGSDKRPEKYATVKPGAGGAFNYTIYARVGSKDKTPPTGKETVGAGKKDIKNLQVKLPEKWKDDGTLLGERRFVNDGMIFFAALHSGKAPVSPEELAAMAKKNENMFPARIWVKTTGIGKFADGVFIVGVCKAGGFEHNGIAIARNVDGVTVLFLGAPRSVNAFDIDFATRKELLDMCKSATFAAKTPDAPPDLGKDKTPPGKRPKLADLKFTLPKGWEAKYSDAVTWRISHGGFVPSISAWWMVERNYPKDLDDLVKRMQETDYFGNGMYLTSVSEKGKLPDGLYVVGKFTVGKAGKESKYIGIAMIRDFGGYQLKFESFSTSYDDAKLLKEAMDICKSASFSLVPAGDKKEKFDPAKVRKLQATLPEGWKDDGTVLDVRRFYKDAKQKLSVFALLYRDEAPKSAEALAALAKKDPTLFPHRKWVKTKGIGKLPDGFFIVGIGKVMGSEEDAIGAVRTIGGKTVLFMCVPAGQAAARKEMLGVVRSAKWQP